MKKIIKENISITILFLIILSIIILKNGFWIMPNFHLQFEVTKNLTNNPFSNPDAHCLMLNYLAPSLFHLIGGETFLEYTLFYLSFSLLFLFIFIFWFIKYHNLEIKTYYKILPIITFPIFIIPFYWIGMDSLTLFLMLLIMINFNSKESLIFAFLLGLHHFEQGIASFGLLFLTQTIFQKELLKKTLSILIFLLLAKILLHFWFYLSSITLEGDRYTYMKNHISLHIKEWKSSFYFIFYSIFGVGWLLILREIKNLYYIIPSLFITLFFIMTVEDQTRVATILLFPTLFFLLFQNRDIIKNISLNFSIFAFIFYLIIPTTIIWKGEINHSLLKHDKLLLKNFKRVEKLNLLLPFSKP